jgi:DNA-binding MarR family transcriptional regulator
MAKKSKYEDTILRKLRRITRAIDLHSRRLAIQFGLTGPQLVCLRVLEDKGPLTPSNLAREVALSQGTITGIVDRLFKRGLVTRNRSSTDRRSVTVAITEKGQDMIKKAPSPLQESFAIELRRLPEENQLVIHTILEQIVRMMGAEDVEAAPVLSSGPPVAPASAVEEFLDQDNSKDLEDSESKAS